MPLATLFSLCLVYAGPASAQAGLYSGFPAGSGPAIRNILGVSSHMYQGTGPNSDRDFELGVYKSLGGLGIREDFMWYQIEPQKGVWHFEAVDTQVKIAGKVGVRISAILAYGVHWAMKNRQPGTIAPDVFAEYAGRVAGRYCGEIKDYEVWNEPDIQAFWSPNPEAVQYVRLLAAARDAIKSACPSARVISGGMASYSDLKKGRWWFLDEMHSARPDVCSLFDVLGLHPYSADSLPPEFNRPPSAGSAVQGQTEMVRIAREKLKKIGCPDKPIRFTEVGWASYKISEEMQGRFLARSILLALKDGVDGYFWYTFWDGRPGSAPSSPQELHYGLFRWPEQKATRREKQAFKALTGLLRIVGDSRFSRDLSPALGLPEGVYSLAFVEAAGAITLAMWDGRDYADAGNNGRSKGWRETSFSVTLPAPEGMPKPVLFSIYGTPLPCPESGPDGTIKITLTPSVQYLRLSPAKAKK